MKQHEQKPSNAAESLATPVPEIKTLELNELKLTVGGGGGGGKTGGAKSGSPSSESCACVCG